MDVSQWPDCQPLRHLAVQAVDKASVILSGRPGLLQFSALAPDLFRLRATRSEAFAPDYSWALAKRDWPLVAARVHQNRTQVTLMTPQAAFQVHLPTGSWLLKVAGAVSVASAPDGNGFEKESSAARISLKIADEEAIFGLGESTGTFNKRGLIREFWNMDVLGHAPGMHPALRSL